MQWRGQGVLVGVVLTAAGVFGYQWVSMTGMVEKITYEGVEYAQYTQLVSQFVEEKQRWPESHEIIMPKPPRKGVIKSATLQNNGDILFVLSGWGIRTGKATVLLSPTLNTHSHLLPSGRNRLEYNCTAVNPASHERVLCGGMSTSIAADINNKNANAFAEWAKNESNAKNELNERKSVLDVANNSQTQCDVHIQHLEQQVIPCLTQIDESAAQQINERFQKALNRPRLRPEIIADNPDLVAEYNRECDNDWNMYGAMAKRQNSKFEGCF